MFAHGSIRRLFTLIAVISPVLAGCEAASGVLLARATVDGVSLIATGKSSNGHGLSVIAGEDCEPLRMLADEPICRPDDYPDSAARLGDAVAEPHNTAVGSVFADAARNEYFVDPVTLPEFTDTEEPERYVVIASFDDSVDARAAAWNLADLPATTTTVKINGIPYYRVVVGPLEPSLERVLAVRLANAGVMSFYPVMLCPRDQSEPPCLGAPQYRPVIDPDRVAAVTSR